MTTASEKSRIPSRGTKISPMTMKRRILGRQTDSRTTNTKATTSTLMQRRSAQYSTSTPTVLCLASVLACLLHHQRARQLPVSVPLLRRSTRTRRRRRRKNRRQTDRNSRPTNAKKPRTGQQSMHRKAMRPLLLYLLLCPRDGCGGGGRALVASTSAAVLLTSVVFLKIAQAENETAQP